MFFLIRLLWRRHEIAAFNTLLISQARASLEFFS
jgi:hypothetical protein